MSILLAFKRSGAVLSSDGKYRYALWRRFDTEGPQVMFLMCNPSTADHAKDDPTIRRCIGFARSWGYDRLAVGNLFAFRATDPAAMRKADDPVGPQNDEWLRRLADESDLIVAAWGTHGHWMGRDKAVRGMFPGCLYHLGLTGCGQPKHPLYLRADSQPQPWADPIAAGGAAS